MKTKTLLITGVALTALLGGCASHKNIEQSINDLSHQMTHMNAEIGTIKADLAATTNEARNAYGEAKRANARLDHIASHYRK